MVRSQIVYSIIDTSNLPNINFKKLKESSSSTIRYNKDKTKCIVKYIGENTNIINVPLYQKNQIIEKLKEFEWR